MFFYNTFIVIRTTIYSFEVKEWEIDIKKLNRKGSLVPVIYLWNESRKGN